MRVDCIYFVWNAEHNLKGACLAIADFVQNKHSCSLCEIAYHTVTQKGDWKDYKQALSIPVEEMYRNQLSEEGAKAAGHEYPAVLARVGNHTVKLLGKAEIDACDGDLDKFKELLDSRLARYAD